MVTYVATLDVPRHSRDAGVSQATGYRYLHEGIDVLAEQVPDLHDSLDRCRRDGMPHVILDGSPLWVSDVEPGSTPDITAGRIHALPALYKPCTPTPAPRTP